MDKIKNGYINNFALLLIGLLFFSSACFAKNPYKMKGSSEVIITAADSIIRIHIPTKAKIIKADNKSVYYWYANNRVYSNKGGYSGKLLDGEYRVYDKEGKLLCFGNFSQGRKKGVWKFWDKNGALIKTEPWHKGLIYGKVYEYNSFGRKQKVSSFKKGVKHGREEVCLKKDTVLVNKYRYGVLLVPKAKAKKQKMDRKKETPTENGKKKFHLFKRKKDKNNNDNLLRNKPEKKKQKAGKLNTNTEKDSIKKSQERKIKKDYPLPLNNETY